MGSEFTIPDNLDTADLQARLPATIRLSAKPPQELQQIYYDTFDWRLFARKEALIEQRAGKEHKLEWRAFSNNNRHAHILLSKPPKFAWDLPPGGFRDRLEPVIEMRELIPLARIRTRIHAIHALNRDDKTVARLLIEENTLRGKGSRGSQPDRRAIVQPVKGYPKPFEQLVQALEAMGLSPADTDPMQAALEAAGLKPGSYSSKLNLHLDPAMRADQATKLILKRLLDIMLQNEAGTRTGTDSEFLHDFRVSIRRTRSAITQIKGVFPLRIVNRYKSEFAWLGQITSPMRDMDVYLLTFDEYRDSLPASFQADIEPLRDFLLRHQKRAHTALVKALDSARYRKLIASWGEFLEQPVPERTTLPNARRPVRDLAGERIWRIYRRALKEGRAIETHTPAEALHELRKTCKKLRYLMEFFQSLYPTAEIKALIRVLKVLQDNLGNFQDYEVQVLTLKDFSHQMVAEGSAPPDTLLAMGMLIEGLERRQHAERGEFAERFTHFSLPENQDHFRQLFTTTGTPSS